jgi:alginate O-acetyltransferase complex protein AlgI
VYGDFSGYSDIAIGAGKLFGFKLSRNFNYPFQARDWADLWRRWHISLTTWFRDYLYYPLGGSRVPRNRVVFNVMVVFTVSGFWHGADWNYVTWGVLCGLMFIPGLLKGSNRKYLDIIATGRKYPTAHEVWLMIRTFVIFSFTLIFFRNESLPDVWQYFWAMRNFDFDLSLKIVSHFNIWMIAAVMIVIEWNARFKEYPLQDSTLSTPKRWLVYLVMAWAIVISAVNNDTFIYFQF